MNQLITSTPTQHVPALFAAAGERGVYRFLEFFTRRSGTGTRATSPLRASAPIAARRSSVTGRSDEVTLNEIERVRI
jgi:hypothetical protein